MLVASIGRVSEEVMSPEQPVSRPRPGPSWLWQFHSVQTRREGGQPREAVSRIQVPARGGHPGQSSIPNSYSGRVVVSNL